MFKWWLILDALILSVFELDGVCAFYILVVLGESLVGRLSHDENFIHLGHQFWRLLLSLLYALYLLLLFFCLNFFSLNQIYFISTLPPINWFTLLFHSFEQFCINFANEKLQQHFNEVRNDLLKRAFTHMHIDSTGSIGARVSDIMFC